MYHNKLKELPTTATKGKAPHPILSTQKGSIGCNIQCPVATKPTENSKPVISRGIVGDVGRSNNAINVAAPCVLSPVSRNGLATAPTCPRNFCPSAYAATCALLCSTIAEVLSSSFVLKF